MDQNLNIQGAAMRNTSKKIISLLIFFFGLTVCLSSYADQKKQCSNDQDITKPNFGKNGQTSTICVHGRNFILLYNYKKRLLSVRSSQPASKVILERVANGFGPELVLGGAESIRFLPVNLQPYLDQKKLLYLSSKRSTGGNGGGQCGAGLEEFLNVLDINSNPPKFFSSFLIASCNENIFLDEDGSLNPRFFSGFSVEENQLKITFGIYKNIDSELSPVGTISKDFKSLEFGGN